ncbi:hypothetical protein CEP54_000154 [Fusarium duplospermum]|uniref:Uncharacterized protein n=1 Tax=Fusarium duplospermum TaxID=1325734 RepID=A0A428R8G1_9HYPO|nr:hypothetical protein CEP54_000154 [Fusarium duplospermum]
MSRARKTKNPKRRRRERRKRILREYCALVDQEAAQADGAEQDGAEPPTTALPSDKDAPGPENVSTADQKTPSSEKKRRCKHRKLPDRLYHYRPGKMERQYLGLQRRVTSAVDDKVAQGSAALDKWKRDASVFMDKFKRKGEEEREMMKRDLNRVRNVHGVRLESLENRIDTLNKRVREVREKCYKLKD